jgi:signal peptidase I
MGPKRTNKVKSKELDRSGMSKGKKKKKETKQPTWRHITENIECLAIAIVMALILKFFLIEAYKIPTGSMQPTIIGNEEQGIFDRVLVNKFIYQLSEPKRWDVIVFKYPLNQSKNYIKRLIGLPNERVEIKNGDIYINDAIERKPESAVRAVMKQVFPTRLNNESFHGFFKTEGDCEVRDKDRVSFTGPGFITTKDSIRADYLHGYDPDYKIPRPDFVRRSETQAVGDLRIAFEVTLHDDRGGIQARIQEEGKAHTFFLKGKNHPEPSYISTGRVRNIEEAGAKEVWTDPDRILEAGKTYEVCFSNIDDRLRILLDGDEIACYEYEDGGVPGKHRDNRITFGPLECGADFEDICVFRDIYYLPGGNGTGPDVYEVPVDHYFALGDNTQNSSDSRLWSSLAITRPDGTVDKGNNELYPHHRSVQEVMLKRFVRSGLAFTDIYGDNRVIPPSEISYCKARVQSEHYIHKKLMLGKALVIFWPIYPHFRWKLIR